MGFIKQFDSHMAVLFDRLSESVTYTPDGGTAQPVQAVVEYRAGNSDYFTATNQSPTLSMDVRAVDVASPAEGDLIRWGETDYRIASKELNDDRLTWSLLLHEVTA